MRSWSSAFSSWCAIRRSEGSRDVPEWLNCKSTLAETLNPVTVMD
jgi:hypothetical protein